MDLQQIPKTFWHSLSLAVLVISFGFTLIAYRSSSISLEMADARLTLSSEINSSKTALKAGLDQAIEAKNLAEKKYEELLQKSKLFQSKISQIEPKANGDITGKSIFEESLKNCHDCHLSPFPSEPFEFKKFDENIEEVQKSINRLEAIQKEIQFMR